MIQSFKVIKKKPQNTQQITNQIKNGVFQIIEKFNPGTITKS